MVRSRIQIALEVQRRRLPVHADVRDVPARTNEVDGELEGLRGADGLDRDVRAKPSGELLDDSQRVLSARVHDDVGSEPLRRLKPGVDEVDRDDVARAEEACGQDRGEADRSRADDRDDVARPASCH